ncbi:hypothetical protein [Bradyrhizobium erythrophlei]|jgi:hypothetical protein|uniref:Uncharacterized protein n=1 Tax=Bradyrhizobium erythrophlei TaxID=1437360 RepID=A0A1M7TJZ7_9BRAD|nr:hypothetical protein [Bradyrhizobium erythrophlei]SHN71072.1 hypothetical protein SAMN05444170_1922 [Bradyrhizobium erythrophlei]
MSKHHTLPPIIYTPPPKPKKTEKKRRIGVGLTGELDETAETRESGAANQPMPMRLPAQNFPEIEGADRKPRHPSGRLSQGTLSVLLQAQELK